MTIITYKGKGKGHPITGHEGPEGEQMCSSTLPLTSALDGVGGQHHAPAALPPGKTRYQLYHHVYRIKRYFEEELLDHRFSVME